MKIHLTRDVQNIILNITTPWSSDRVSIVPVTDFYEALRERGAESLIRDFEKLKKGIVKPELQQEPDIRLDTEKAIGSGN